MKCERCGNSIKGPNEIAEWLARLLEEAEQLALVRMIDADERAKKIAAAEAKGERSSAMLSFIQFQLKQLITGINACPHDKPARPSTAA